MWEWQRQKSDCTYAARQGMMSYNSNTMHSPKLLKVLERGNAWFFSFPCENLRNITRKYVD